MSTRGTFTSTDHAFLAMPRRLRQVSLVARRAVRDSEPNGSLSRALKQITNTKEYWPVQRLSKQTGTSTRLLVLKGREAVAEKKTM
jgi:hypothetical protein